MNKKDKPNRIVDLVVMVVVFGVMGFSVYSGLRSGTSGLESEPAPAFQAMTASGVPVSNSALSGKVVVLDFWATWCPPCRKQMPVLQDVKRANPDVAVVSVNVDDPGPDRKHLVQGYLMRNNLEFDVVYDDGPLMTSFKVTRFPTMIVVSPSGMVTYADSGFMTRSEIEALIREAKGT